jgi:hypothetical protein
MFRLRSLIPVVIAVSLGAPVGFAQNAASPPTQSHITSSPGIETLAPKQTYSNRIRTWSSARWKAWQESWSKRQQKWDACVKESQERKMSVHRRTHFLDECMQR